MFDLEKREKAIILVLLAVLLAGLSLKLYQKSNQIIGVKIRSFSYDSISREYPKININEADKLSLTKLPGIGRELAKRIVDYRSAKGYFRSTDEIKKVKGIGDKLFEKIKDKVCIE